MLSKSSNHALKALLVLAGDPQRWRSTHDLAIAQQLPEPMLEQLMLRLRRAGVLVARRGRLGGYRLARPAREISLAVVLARLEESAPPSAATEQELSSADQVTRALQQRLERARQRALEELSLEDLLFDLRSAEASADSASGLLFG